MSIRIVLLDAVQSYSGVLSSLTEREQIARYIDRQRELGHFLKKPVSAMLRDGIYELRPGPHRLLFFFHEGAIIVCHAFRKRTQKTPDREIEYALNIRKRYQTEGT